MEVAADDNLWIHLKFGFVGSLNDLNIWAHSMMKLSFTNRTLCDKNFDYIIFGLTFTTQYYLIKAIYPESQAMC